MFGDLIHFGDYISYGELLLRVLLTVVIGAAIGIDREVKSRPAGMRTHVLVCLGAMLVALVEQQTVANAYGGKRHPSPTQESTLAGTCRQVSQQPHIQTLDAY